MSRERIASYVLVLCMTAAAAAKAVRIEESVRDLAALAAGLGLGHVEHRALCWLVVALIAAELTMAAALVTPRHRRRGLVALLVLVACGVVTVGVASRWGARADFGCPCGLAVGVPPSANVFTAMLLRDAALVALAAMAWGPPGDAVVQARVRPG